MPRLPAPGNGSVFLLFFHYVGRRDRVPLIGPRVCFALSFRFRVDLGPFSFFFWMLLFLDRVALMESVTVASHWKRKRFSFVFNTTLRDRVPLIGLRVHFEISSQFNAAVFSSFSAFDSFCFSVDLDSICILAHIPLIRSCRFSIRLLFHDLVMATLFDRTLALDWPWSWSLRVPPSLL